MSSERRGILVLVTGLAGLVIGAMFTLSLSYTFRLQDTYSRSLMGVLQKELSSLRAAARQPQCDPLAVAATAQKFKWLSADIVRAVPRRWGDDREFQDLALSMQQQAEAFARQDPIVCGELAPIAARLAESCENCHDRFRGK